MRTVNDLFILNDIDDYLGFLNDMDNGYYFRDDDNIYYTTATDKDGFYIEDKKYAKNVTSSILLDVAHAVVKTVNKLI